MKALLSETIELLVPFHDADPMGVTWHGNYLRYFEQARCAMLDKIGYNYRQMDQSGYLWPIVDARLKYVSTSTFEQRIRVTAALVEFENRMKIEYRIEDAQSGRCLTKGHTIQVAVDKQTGEMCYVSPKVFLDALNEAGICVDG